MSTLAEHLADYHQGLRSLIRELIDSESRLDQLSTNELVDLCDGVRVARLYGRIPLLEQLCEHSEESVRCAACFALGTFNLAGQQVHGKIPFGGLEMAWFDSGRENFDAVFPAHWCTSQDAYFSMRAPGIEPGIEPSIESGSDQS